MKFITKYIIILVIGTILIGCDSYLEEEPKAITSPDTFFNTIEEFELANVGLYETWQQNYLHGNIGLYRFTAECQERQHAGGDDSDEVPDHWSHSLPLRRWQRTCPPGPVTSCPDSAIWQEELLVNRAKKKRTRTRAKGARPRSCRTKTRVVESTPQLGD